MMGYNIGSWMCKSMNMHLYVCIHIWYATIRKRPVEGMANNIAACMYIYMHICVYECIYIFIHV